MENWNVEILRYLNFLVLISKEIKTNSLSSWVVIFIFSYFFKDSLKILYDCYNVTLQTPKHAVFIEIILVTTKTNKGSTKFLNITEVTYRLKIKTF